MAALVGGVGEPGDQAVAAMMGDTRQEHGMSEVRTLTLTEFLTARLDEDEVASSESWRLAPEGWYSASDPYGAEWTDFATTSIEDAEHIAHYSPARMLAEVEAKRQILSAHQPAAKATHGFLNEGRCMTCVDFHADMDCEQQPYPCRTLRLLALPYADHPDYREEWKP